MNCDIVIAHYKENIDWLDFLKADNINNIYLYTKNPEYKLSELLKKHDKIIHTYLPNIGRETQTYLYHCKEHYNQINNNDFIIFLQGNPFFHRITGETLLHWLDEIKNNNITYTQNFYVDPIQQGLNNKRMKFWGSPTEQSKYTLEEWINVYIKKNIDLNKNHKIYWNANFGILKKYISTRSIDEYNIVINNELSTINPECTHFMERLWYYWFNLDQAEENV